MFHHYDLIFLSKAISGGTTALKIIYSIRKHAHVAYYLIGNGFTGFEQYKTYPEQFAKLDELIVESPALIPVFENLGVKSVHVFPCLKPSYPIEFLPKTYDENSVIELLYFSRLCANKGVFLAIDATIKANEILGKQRFHLSIAGGLDNPKELAPSGELIEDYVTRMDREHPEITYLGLSLRASDLESYQKIQQYDLHLLPSMFGNECAPGSVFDMFIAGVPTLSSAFESAKYIMSEEDSYFAKVGDLDALVQALLSISKDTDGLSKRRERTFAKSKGFTIESFRKFFLSKILK